MKTYQSRRARIAKQKKVKLLPSWLMLEFYAALLTSFFLASFFATYIVHTPKVHAQTAGVNKPRVHTLSPATSAVTPTPYQYNAKDVIRRIWGKDAYIGVAIASCESGLNPDAINYNNNNSTDFSIFQVNDAAHRVILDPEENIRYAYQLYLDQGTTPWLSSAHCWKEKL